MERWIEQPDIDGQAVHRLEDSLKVAALHRQELGQCAAAPADVARHDHLAHRVDALTLEEHVFRATQAYAFGAKATGDARVLRRVCVRPDPQATNFVSPPEQP